MGCKNALVTGGGSGIGLAIARKLASDGFKVIILGREESKLKTAVDEIGNESVYYVFDLSQFDQIPSFVKKVVSEQGSLDVLVNNAGIHLKKSMQEMTDDEFLRVINTNETAVFSLTREVSKVMIDQKSGVVLNVSSMASQYGIPLVMGYTAAKSAIEGMTRAMAVELSPLGIRVNCIAPGFIETAMSRKALAADPERKNKVLSRTPMRRLGQVEEIASAAAFLCSDAASFVTGVVLPVDGGNSIGF